MKNTLYHFGSEFADPQYNKYIFTPKLGELLNYDVQILGKQNDSNQDIFGDILKKTFEYKDGDIILINWAPKNRLPLFYEEEFFDYLRRDEFFEKAHQWVPSTKVHLQNITDTLNVQIFNVFQKMISNFFEPLEENKNVSVFHIFDFKFGIYTWPTFKSINFENGYYDYLQKNKYMNSKTDIEGMGLYTENSIQPLAETFYNIIVNDDYNNLPVVIEKSSKTLI